MANVQELLNGRPGTISIDWTGVEKEVRFPVHQDLKDFYSRLTETRNYGKVDFAEAKFIEKTGDKRNDTWFSFNECEGSVEYQLILIKSPENAAQEIRYAFEEWTGGNDFGHRAMIGEFYFNMGSVLILFNNDTGKIEWIDCEYGYFEVYDENPNGVLANSMKEFFEKFCS